MLSRHACPAKIRGGNGNGNTATGNGNVPLDIRLEVGYRERGMLGSKRVRSMPDTSHSDNEVFATKIELAEQETRMTRETLQLMRELTRELRDKIDSSVAELRDKMDSSVAELRDKMDSSVTEMRELHAETRDKMGSSVAELRESLHDLTREMARRDRWTITTVLAIAAVVIALMRFEII